MTPEQQSRQEIDRQLEQCGWIVQSFRDMNISAGLGVAVREFPLKSGFADYLLYTDCKPRRDSIRKHSIWMPSIRSWQRKDDNAVAEKQSMSEGDSMWSQKGATMSDKSARQEFGLTQQDIIAAIRAGKLQFRQSNMHGNPWYRLLRHEVESLVRDKSGLENLTKKKLQKELADLNTEARKLTTRMKAIERRRTELMKELDG